MFSHLPKLISRSFALPLCCVAALTASDAVAQNMSAAVPDTLVNGLQDLGFRAELDTDNEGDPRITSASSGFNFVIYFYGCEDNLKCQDILFASSFDLDDAPSISDMNNWNMNKIIGRAYIDDEGDPNLEHFVAGVTDMSPDALDRLMNRWDLALGEFAEVIGW